MSWPRSSKWVAKEWRKVRQLAAFVTLASVTARFTAFCATLGSRWCLHWLPDSHSRQRLCWGNTDWSPRFSTSSLASIQTPAIPGAGTP